MVSQDISIFMSTAKRILCNAMLVLKICHVYILTHYRTSVGAFITLLSLEDLRRIPTHFIKPLCRLWDTMVYDNRCLLSSFVRAPKNVLAEYKKAEVYNSDITSPSAHSISPKDFEKKLYLAVCEIAKGDTSSQLSKFYLSRFGRELIARNDRLTADLDKQPDIQRVPTTPGTCIWQQ